MFRKWVVPYFEIRSFVENIMYSSICVGENKSIFHDFLRCESGCAWERLEGATSSNFKFMPHRFASIVLSVRRVTKS